MAKAQASPAVTVGIDRFAGVSEDTAGEICRNVAYASTMRNFRVTENYRLRKRNGYRRFLSEKNILCAYAADIGDTPYFFYKKGDVVTAVHGETGEVVATVTVTAADAVPFFTFGGLVYFGAGGQLYTFDGTTFAEKKAYIPKIAVTAPNTGGGTLYESLNCISPYARISFSPDGAGSTFVLPTGALSVTQVLYNGEQITGYVYDPWNRTLSLSFTPAGDIPDSLEVTFRVNMTGNGFFHGRQCCVYGGEFDTRVFVYGGDNVIYYSDITDLGADCTYFPAENFITVGDGSHAVTALCRHYDRLMVFLPGETYYISPSSVDYDGYSKPTFPLFPLNGKIGNICPAGVHLIENQPVSVMRDGVYLWTSSNIKDERNAERISAPISKAVETGFLSRCVTLDDEKKGELYFSAGSLTCIYNYRLGAWYFYDGFDVTGLFLLNGSVGFYNGTGVYLFSEDCYDDDGSPIRAVWESGYLDFSRPNRRKNLYRLYFSMMSEANSSIKLTLLPNAGSPLELSANRFSGTVLNFSHIDFDHFSFECENRPRCYRVRVPLRHFSMLKVRAENSETDGRATLCELYLEGACPEELR